MAHPPRLKLEEALERASELGDECRRLAEIVPIILERTWRSFRSHKSLPDFHFLDSLEFEAYATSEHEIEISLGVLLKAVDVEHFVILGDASMYGDGGEVIMGGMPISILHWVVGHEAAHLAHCHFEAASRLGPDSIAALEYDADLTGILIAYQGNRHLGGETKVFSSDLDVKRFTLAGIYWGIRQIFKGTSLEASHQRPYLSWMARLRLAGLKIAMINNFTQEEANSLDAYQREPFFSQMKALQLDLFQFEKSFARLNSLPPPTRRSPGAFFSAMTTSDPEVTKVIELWESVRPHIEELSTSQKSSESVAEN